jgi:hypothetical protein
MSRRTTLDNSRIRVYPDSGADFGMTVYFFVQQLWEWQAPYRSRQKWCRQCSHWSMCLKLRLQCEIYQGRWWGWVTILHEMVIINRQFWFDSYVVVISDSCCAHCKVYSVLLCLLLVACFSWKDSFLISEFILTYSGTHMSVCTD